MCHRQPRDYSRHPVVGHGVAGGISASGQTLAYFPCLLSRVNRPARLTPHKPKRLSPADIRSIITGLMLAILLGALDQTVISVSLPQMATDLLGVDLLAWWFGYLIAMAVATPVYGKLGDIYGRRTVLSSAIVLFLVVCCMRAGTQYARVGGRPYFAGAGWWRADFRRPGHDCRRGSPA